ncbi:MAG: DUF1778 domain-containing protein [Magnetococcales bacterium]|nr:DUF1778 domain-containing protein [Magnetococcales bacterium]NGZ26649.1 DUF1778 domain-containing protein [Magnetococcales bacterium]
MPRSMIERNDRVSLPIRPEDKAILMRAVALADTDLATFVLQSALKAAKKNVIEQAERIQLAKRDSLRVLKLLENPPKPNAKLLSAAQSMPTLP